MSYFRMTIFSTAAATLLMVGCLTSADKPGHGEGPGLSDDVTNAFSEVGTPDEHSPGPLGGLGGFGEALALTDSQKTDIHEKIDSLRHAMRALRGEHHRGDARPSFDSLKAMRKQMREATWQAVTSVLTDEQKAKADSIRADLESGKIPPPMARARAAFLKEKLGLDSAQTDSIQSILAAAMLARMAAFDLAGNFEDLHTAMRAIDDKAEADLLAVLNATQAEAFKALKATFHSRRHLPW